MQYVPALLHRRGILDRTGDRRAGPGHEGLRGLRSGDREERALPRGRPARRRGDQHHPAPRNGRLVTTDGPFAETKEQLGGYHLIECRDLDEAIAIARRIPMRPRRIGTELSHDVLQPSSRTALIGEQPNPWNLLQLQDAMSRHRGAKPPRRCGLLGEISLLSPGRSPHPDPA